MRSRATVHGTRSPRGITLLEVLISCGLLIVGLSSIAALLPVASSRLSQATTEDRAATLLTNATAEILARGIAAADSFPSNLSGGGTRTLAIGRVIGELPGCGGLPSGRQAGEYFTGPSDEGRKRCGSGRTFVLEDVVKYDPPRYSDTPTNAFTSDGAGYGPRRFQEGMCWGATLTPVSLPPTSGGEAILSVAVFKRGGENEDGTFAAGVPVVLTRLESLYEADLIESGSLLRHCSWLLAIPPDASLAPRWFRIMSSWPWTNAATDPRPGLRVTRVVLRGQEDFAKLTGTEQPGASATVFAFDGILKVDEQRVTLN